MRRQVWIGVGVLVLLALIAILALYSLERVTKQEPVQPGAEARRDRFLLAERTLGRLGLKSVRIAALDSTAPLPADSMLLLPARRGLVTRTALQRLLAYVEAGGHLVVESESIGIVDPVFDAFAITREEYPWEDEADAYSFDFDFLRERGKTAEYEIGMKQLAMVQMVEDGPQLAVFMHGGEALDAGSSLWRAGDAQATRVLHFARGEGRVTAINDVRFATNDELARGDNAEFLWQLAQVGGAATQVLIYRGHTETLWQWLLRNALAVLLALAALLLLWLWSAMPRFGPRLPDPQPVRRRLLDHLAASGRFLWAHGQRQRLVAAGCRHARESVQQRYPHLCAARDGELATFIARRFGIAPELAGALVEPPAVRHAHDLIELARACASVHRELARTSTTTRPKASA